MSVKPFIALVIIAIAGYVVFNFWQKAARMDFCDKMEACLSERSFYAQFHNSQECASGDNEALEAFRTFRDCDQDMNCDDWLECGFGDLDERRGPIDKGPKTDFEQALEHMPDE